jgi:hypothetical protein
MIQRGLDPSNAYYPAATVGRALVVQLSETCSGLPTINDSTLSDHRFLPEWSWIHSLWRSES